MNRLSEEPVQNPYFLLVLGPHRCGTSVLSGVLNQLGADLPKTLMPATERNAAGYFESVRIMNFNEKLLNALGSDWKDLSPIDTGAVYGQVLESFMADAVQLLHEEFSAARLPLLKDPRICRLVNFWTEALLRAGYRPLYIHTHRNPLEMADSLAKRDDIPIEVGLLIWMRHVLDAEAATRGKARAFTNYKALLGNWSTQIEQIEQELGLKFHRKSERVHQEISDFVSDALHHQKRGGEEVQKSPHVAKMVREVFTILEGWIEGRAIEADYERLDQLRHRLDIALDPIAIFMRAQDNVRTLASEREAELERDVRQYRLEAEEENARTLQAQQDIMCELKGKLRERQERISTLERQLLEIQGELTTERGERSQLVAVHEKEQSGLRETVHGLETEILTLERQLLEIQAELMNERTEKSHLVAVHEQDQMRLHDAVRGLELKIGERFREIAKISEMLLMSQQQHQEDLKGRENSEARVEALLSSTSWKITAPLRRVKMLFHV